MMWYLYDAGIRLFVLALRLYSLFNEKGKALIEGRAQSHYHNPVSTNKPVICFHCASLGEFEMIRPLLTDELRAKYFVTITFFSPSGYKHAKCEGLIDQKFYLPFDTPKNVNRFLDFLKPSVFVFVKYDFWFRLIHALKQRHITTILVNGLFRPNQFLFSESMRFFRTQLADFDKLFVQDQASATILRNARMENLEVTGDLRYDRVISICENAVPIERIQKFKQDKPLLMLGSSWPEEEKLLAQVYKKLRGRCKVVIAPHDVSDDHVQRIQSLFGGVEINLWSDNEKADSDILILNTIGLLSTAYQHADVAFIGGAFGKGLHNILEAATFGMPIICGPKTDKYPEASTFQTAQILYKISTSSELLNTIDLFLNDETKRTGTAIKSRLLVRSSSGAAEIINRYLKGLRFG